MILQIHLRTYKYKVETILESPQTPKISQEREEKLYCYSLSSLSWLRKAFGDFDSEHVHDEMFLNCICIINNTLVCTEKIILLRTYPFNPKMALYP